MRNRRLRKALRALLGDESGQATAEYVSITTIFLMGGLATFAGWPITERLFQGLQSYIDFYFFALNLAVG